jgi:hypothetical protein
LQNAGYAIVNVDATVGLERPRLSPHIPRMQKKTGPGARAGPRPSQCESQDRRGRGRHRSR